MRQVIENKVKKSVTSSCFTKPYNYRIYTIPKDMNLCNVDDLEIYIKRF